MSNYEEGYSDGQGSMDLRVERLEAENEKLREYKSAFVKLGAEIAQAGCCTHGPLANDSVNDPPIHAANCIRERLILRFLTVKRALEQGK